MKFGNPIEIKVYTKVATSNSRFHCKQTNRSESFIHEMVESSKSNCPAPRPVWPWHSWQCIGTDNAHVWAWWAVRKLLFRQW